MFAGVPCYRLKDLHEEIKWDLPEMKGVVGAWREMRETWAAQEQWKKETGDKRRERAEKREREAAASLQSEPDKENQPAEPAAEAAEPSEP